MTKLQAWTGEPQVIEFNYLIDSRGKTPTPSHEVRVMRRYPPQPTNIIDMKFISCGCPRTVRPGRWITVWHSPECPEIDRDA